MLLEILAVDILDHRLQLVVRCSFQIEISIKKQAGETVRRLKSPVHENVRRQFLAKFEVAVDIVRPSPVVPDSVVAVRRGSENLARVIQLVERVKPVRLAIFKHHLGGSRRTLEKVRSGCANRRDIQAGHVKIGDRDEHHRKRQHRREMFFRQKPDRHCEQGHRRGAVKENHGEMVAPSLENRGIERRVRGIKKQTDYRIDRGLEKRLHRREINRSREECGNQKQNERDCAHHLRIRDRLFLVSIIKKPVKPESRQKRCGENGDTPESVRSAEFVEKRNHVENNREQRTVFSERQKNEERDQDDHDDGAAFFRQ